MPSNWEKPRVWASIGDKRYCCPTKETEPHVESCVRRATWDDKKDAPVVVKEEPITHSPSASIDLQLYEKCVNTSAAHCVICKNDKSAYACNAFVSVGSVIRCSRDSGHEGPCHSHGTNCCMAVWRRPNKVCSQVHPSGRACERHINHADFHCLTQADGRSLIW